MTPIRVAPAHSPLTIARRVIPTMLVLGVLFAFAAKGMAPHVLRDVAHGHGFGWLRSHAPALSNPATLQRHLDQASELANTFLVAWAVLIALLAAMSTRGFERRFVPAATPESLGAIRILVCAIVLVSAVWEDLPSGALLSPDMRRPEGIIWLLYHLPIHFSALVGSATALRCFQWFTIALLAASLVGWRTRVIMPLAVAAWIVMGGICRQYEHFYHAGLLAMYLLAVLACTPCGDSLSVDRLLRQHRGLPVATAHIPASIYGWSRYACWVTVALGYLLAALSKLRLGGPFWWNATNLKVFIYMDVMQPKNFNTGIVLHLTRAPGAVFALIGLASLSLELTYILVLFSARARRILPLGAALMHTGIFLLQTLFFYDFIVLQLIFADYSKWRGRLRSRLARSAAGAQEHTDRQVAATAPSPFHMTTPQSQTRFAPLLISATVLLMSVSWMVRHDIYPLTDWSMYASTPDVVPIHYVRLVAHHASGAVSQPDPGDTIGALADGRTRRVLREAWNPDTAKAARHFLQTYGRQLNRQLATDKVTRFELQRWEWDFDAYPAGPHDARLLGRLWFDVPP